MANGDVMTKEAGEHIENLNRGLHLDPDKQECRTLHGDCARALIWVIRKIEALYKKFEDKAVESYEDRQKKPCRTLKLWPGSQIPLERGFTPRDAIALVLVCGVLYIIIQLHKSGVF